MMMRYLGLGVGHRNPADFPREDTNLQFDATGSHYVYTSKEGGDGKSVEEGIGSDSEE